MNNIVTWEYYNSLYNRATEDSFTNLELQAEKRVISVIGQYRWNHIQESAFYFNQLRDCICMVVDMLIDLDRGNVSKGLASVSNDGYTENYVIRTSNEADTEIRTRIKHWLSGTGLLSAFPLEG